MSLLALADFEAARASIRGVVSATPATRSHSLSLRVRREVWLKPEYLQRTGSFKIRGAYHRLSRLPPRSHVVAGSAGNHAQGVALAAQLLGHRATIFMPGDASLPKVTATKGYGADVVLGGATVDDCIDAAKRFAADHEGIFVPPFDHPDIVAGQGTIGLELLDEVPGLSTVAVAIGGGGLCGGVAAAIKLSRPEVRVIGVTASGASSMIASLAAGTPQSVAPSTIADGIALKAPTELTLSHVRAFVDEVVDVSDDDITAAMLLLLERAKAVVEPAGAATLAAALANRLGPDVGPTALVLGGGNVDPLLLGKCIEHGLSALGRFLRLRFVTTDRPGSLAELTAEFAAMRLNVVDVEHHRSGMRLAVNAVEILVVLETRDDEHRHDVLRAFRDKGFDVEIVE
ncbi:MAG: threonine ammonia-lyase [Acidimicrobiales bacterium]